MTIERDVAQYLSDKQLGVLGDSLFYGRQPPVSSDPVIAIYSSSGEPPTFELGPSEPNLYSPHAQVEVRSSDYGKAMDTSNRLLKVLSLANVIINGVYYLTLHPLQSEPFPLGIDADNRMIVTFNVRGMHR